MSRRRVGVDLCRIDPAALRPADHAVLDTLAAAAAVPGGDVELVLFGSRALRAERPDLFAGVESHAAPFPPAVAALRVAAEATWLRVGAGRARLDLVHDAGGPSRARGHVPTVVSVHDLSSFEGSGVVGRVRSAYARQVLPRAVAGAAAVIVPSAYARARLVELLDVDEAKVRVLPWPLPPHAEAARMDLVRARHGIVGQVVLVPAGADPVEEHLVAVRAMRHLAARHGETTLVLLGGRPGADGPVGAEIRALGLEDRIVRLPTAPEPVRAALFEHAAVVVHLAEHGGFAHAALEAMACGVPVVVADAGGAPELVGDHGAVVAPGDDAQLAIEVHRVLDDPEWRRRRAEAGIARARAHTPAQVAEQLLATYRSVMDGL